MSDGTPDARGHAARVIAALRAQAEGAVDASIPINPQDLLVLLDALDGAGTVHAPYGSPETSPVAPADSVSDRYHGRTPRTLGKHVDDPDAAA